MRRCFQLAQLGKGKVSPNPKVGAVLVHNGTIIGEGFHHLYGTAHAEVQCIQSVSETNRSLIPESVLYVSLEPCNHFGKTPPCTDLILKEGIKYVVISVTDPHSKVNGNGIERLSANGVEVTTGVLETEGVALIQEFFTYHVHKRPYIILKWAQTADGYLGTGTDTRLKISGNMANLLVHKWRSEVDGIAVGTNTVLLDNPRLNNRLWPGKSPVRIVIDQHLKIPMSFNVYDGTQSTIILNEEKVGNDSGVLFVKPDNFDVESFVNCWYEEGLQSVLVEGGASLLNSFMHSGYYDEIRVIEGNIPYGKEGVKAPLLQDVSLTTQWFTEQDVVSVYKPV